MVRIIEKLFFSCDKSVSVIIPSYNYEKYVGKAIESAQNQL
jgi:glycosyltransferase involved in cell wall biosynthesis